MLSALLLFTNNLFKRCSPLFKLHCLPTSQWLGFRDYESSGQALSVSLSVSQRTLQRAEAVGWLLVCLFTRICETAQVACSPAIALGVIGQRNLNFHLRQRNGKMHKSFSRECFLKCHKIKMQLCKFQGKDESRYIQIHITMYVLSLQELKGV